MNVLIVGATGATGTLVTEQLLERGHHVTAIVRSPHKLAQLSTDYDQLTMVSGTALDLPEQALDKLAASADVIVSCLGHNLNFKGLYGKPRRLVRDSLVRLSRAALRTTSGQPKKFILMNTAGNRNPDLDQPHTLGEKLVLSLLRILVPPHPDNEQAAEYLRADIGQDHAALRWVVVRPDSLLDQEQVSEYEVHPSPTRSALFNAGKPSRINVAHFMVSLASNEELWGHWEGKMPVMYNSAEG